MNMKKLLTRQFSDISWESPVVQFQRLATFHFSNGLHYCNPKISKGIIHQISIYHALSKHKKDTRQTFVITLDIVHESWVSNKLASCIVLAVHNGNLVFLETGSHKDVPRICQNASIPGENGDLWSYKQTTDSRHIINVCLEQCKNIWLPA